MLPWRWVWPHPWGEGGRNGIEGCENTNLEHLLGRKVEHSTCFKAPLLVDIMVARVTRWLVDVLVASKRKAPTRRRPAGAAVSQA